MKFLALAIILSLFGSLCLATSSSNLRNLQVNNCRFYNSSGKCIECIYRFVLQGQICKAVSDQCKTWNAVTAACTSCYGGYTLVNGACVIGGVEDPTEDPTVVDPVCYFRQVKINGVCVNVSDQCKTWSNTTAKCKSCYGGYVLSNGACVIGGGSGQGVECYYRQVKINGVCVNVNDQCRTWSETTAKCTGCYGGYILVNGACIIGNEDPTEEPTTEDPTIEDPTTEDPTTEDPIDPNGGSNCVPREVKINGVCVRVSDLCRTWSESTGLCLSCYPGYSLRNGVCAV